MRLIRRSSRRFSPRQVDYTYPELRRMRSAEKRGVMDRSDTASSGDSSSRSRARR